MVGRLLREVGAGRQRRKSRGRDDDSDTHRASLKTIEAVLKYVLDTNAVSAAMKGEPSVLERMRAVGKANLGVPEPVYAEIAYGIERLPKSKRRGQLQGRYELIFNELGSVPWTHSITEHYGVVKAQLERKGKRIEDFDAAIAAHALAVGAVLVTANVSHMTRVSGLVVEDWLEAVD